MQDFNHFVKRVNEEIGDGLTPVNQMFDWNSLNLLIVTALIKEEWQVELSREEIVSSDSLQELFNRIIQGSGLDKS